MVRSCLFCGVCPSVEGQTRLALAVTCKGRASPQIAPPRAGGEQKDKIPIMLSTC